ILFLVLLVGSAAIAWRNWRDDPAQRSGRYVAIWIMRLMIGSMWFQGSLWKLPLPVSGGFQGWTQALGDNAAFEFHQRLAKNVFLIFVQGFFVLDAAGKSLGLDALIARAPFGPFRGSSLIARIYRSLA